MALFRSSNNRLLIRTGIAARILGISEPTLRKRAREGVYPIRWKETVRGLKYDAEDVVKTAYPTADNAQVTELLKSMRDEGVKRW